ncbi:MAG TPA: LysR family transcriptional regulator [Rhodocyclaceae bacterium]
MDKLKAMEIYVRIVEAGSLTAAAERLDTSLSAVVRALAGLEGELGVRLLNRTTRRTALTEEGREYFDRAKRILAEVSDAEAALSAGQEPRGRLSITAPTMFGRLHVMPVVAAFMARYGQVQVDLSLLDRAVDLLEEGIDVAVRIGQLADSSLVALPLGETPRLFCASPAYLARHGTPRRPGELLRHACIVPNSAAHWSEWEFQRRGKVEKIQPAASFRTNQMEVALAACVAGIGCGRFLGYQAATALERGELVRLLQEWEPPAAPVSIAFPHARLMSSRVRTFVDFAAPALKARLAAGR